VESEKANSPPHYLRKSDQPIFVVMSADTIATGAGDICLGLQFDIPLMAETIKSMSLRVLPVIHDVDGP
jgi:hypothetical protein